MKILSLKILEILPEFCQRCRFFLQKTKRRGMFMNRSVNYFAKNDQFEETNFE
jgi:hypothetical protein